MAIGYGVGERGRTIWTGVRHAGAMASGKKAARKPKPATNGLGSDEVDGLQRWGDVPPKKIRRQVKHIKHA